MAKITKKLYIIRKYVWAKTALDALKAEKKIPVDDVWIDDKWKENASTPKDAIGFNIEENSTEQ